MAFEIDFMESLDRDSIVAELQRIAKKLGKKTLTRCDITLHGRMGANTVTRRFGSLQLAHEAAGLIPPIPRLSRGEILKLLVALWKITLKESGRSPSCTELRKYNIPVSISVVTRRFGSWNKALAAAAVVGPSRPMKSKRATVIRAARRTIGDRKRFLIFKRDKYRCRICRRVGGDLELDHVIPVCRGGKSSLDNLQTLCKRCNRGKRGDLQ